MTDILDARWLISDQAIANAVGDEVVVLHLANGTYFGLNPVGAILWNAMAAGECPSVACSQILEKYAIDRETVEQDLLSFLHELEQSDLISRG